MKVVYIAGPFRGNTPWDVECNIRNAEEQALKVSALGGVALCPHTMYRHFDKKLPDKFWIGATAELLRRCDAILLCRGWSDSAGSLEEDRIAREEMKIPRFHANLEGYNELIGWLKE
jgi:hypothetical protein